MKKVVSIFALLLLSGCALAQPPHTFSKYAPANGIQKNPGNTYVDSAAVASDVISLWTGTADASHCLSGAATLVSCVGGGGISPANPTALVGPNPVNGVASTYMTSDSAPAIDETAAYTWSGLHSFTSGIQVQATVTPAVTVTGDNSGDPALQVQQPNAGGSGEIILAGTTATDVAFEITNATNTTQFSVQFGDGGWVLGSATGGDKGLGTINAQALYINNVAVVPPPKFAYGYVNGSGSGCSMLQNVGISGCSRTGPGGYTLTLSAGFTSTPVCTFTPQAAGSVATTVTSTTAVSESLYGASFTLIDGAAYVMCVGT